MLFNKKIKCSFLICLCIVFCLTIGIVIYYENSDLAKEIHINEINLEEIESSLNNIEISKFKIRIGDSEGFYNSKENTYYFYFDEKYSDKFINSKFKVIAPNFEFVILNENYNEDDKVYINFENSYDLLIYDEKEYYKTKIKFTCLPIINITVNADIVPVAQASIIEIYGEDYGDGKGTKKETSEALISFRGGTSTKYPKKQFRLKLRKNNENNKISLLGMDADEDWILDALYSDYSKIRNKLSFDIWNEMNSYTVNKFDNDIEMEYVDVYINEEYHGLYLLKEFVDWKKLGLDKCTESNSGVLIKGIQYGGFNLKQYDEKKVSEEILPFTMKYPKNQMDYSKYWDKIFPKIYTNFFEPEKVTEEYVLENFYVYNYNDYRLFINFICAIDNFKEKNVYVSIKNLNEDTKALLTPWDLDMSYGYNWSNEKSVTSLYEDTNLIYEIRNLWINSDYIDGLLKERYWELRKNIFNMENITKKIDSYYNKIKYSTERDSEKWLSTDLEEEINKIRKWLEKRIEILDKKFVE